LASELRQAMSSIGKELTRKEISEMIREADEDDDSTIDCVSA